MAFIGTLIIDPYLPVVQLAMGSYRLAGAVVLPATARRELPPYGGTGFIAGTSPDGLVTFNGAGAVRTLDLFDRATNIYLVSTVSASDGTYLFNHLNTAMVFDVRARGSSSTENDVIAARITPHA